MGRFTRSPSPPGMSGMCAKRTVPGDALPPPGFDWTDRSAPNWVFAVAL